MNSVESRQHKAALDVQRQADEIGPCGGRPWSTEEQSQQLFRTDTPACRKIERSVPVSNSE